MPAMLSGSLCSGVRVRASTACTCESGVDPLCASVGCTQSLNQGLALAAAPASFLGTLFSRLYLK